MHIKERSTNPRKREVLESITARTKRDHWVPGLPRHRWYTVHQQEAPLRHRHNLDKLNAIKDSLKKIKKRSSDRANYPNVAPFGNGRLWGGDTY